MVRVKMCVSVWQRVGNGVFMQHVCMWWDISLSANTAPQNPLSLRCHREHTDTHNCSSLQHITVFKVCVPVWVGACAKVCESVTSLCHCGFKTLTLESKHCSKHKRGAEEQKQRRAQTHTHTHAARRGGFNATEPESRQRKGGERLRLRHGAETGFKEWKKATRAKQIKRGEPNRSSFLFIHVRQRHGADH